MAVMAALSLCLSAPGVPAAPTQAMGQDGGAFRQGQRQLIEPFDFEEKDTFDWSHLFEQEPELPPKGLFFDASADDQVSKTGRMSLRLDLRGGSISYRTRSDLLIPAEPDSRYLVRGWVRTEDLAHAAARIEMRVVDGAVFKSASATEVDPVLKATVAEFASSPVRTAGEWRNVAFLVDTLGESARVGKELRLVMALQVVQPDFLANGVHDESIPRIEDVKGTAWFDGVEIWQLPRVECRMISGRTGMPSGGMHRSPAAPILEIDVNDPFDSRPTVGIEVRNLDGVLVHEDTFAMESGGGPARYPLGIDTPGWYEVAMRVSSREQLISEQRRTFVVLGGAERRRWQATPRIGFSISDWNAEQLPLIRSVLGEVDPAVLELSIWPPGNDDLSPHAVIGSLRSVLAEQRHGGREVMFAIDRIHPRIATAAETVPEEVAMVLAADPLLWSTELEHWLLAFGTLVDHWRLTALSDAPAELVIPEELRTMMGDLVPDPVLSVPREVDDIGRERQDGLAIYLEADSDLSAGAQSHMLASTDTAGITIKVGSPPQGWGLRDRLDEAAHRIIAAWQGGADRILSPMPGLDMGPEPDILAWASLGSVLGGLRPSGSLHASPTATCLVAEGNDGIVLIASSQRVNEHERIALPLGSTTVDVQSIDGRSWTVSNVDGVHEIEVSSTPVIIHGADRGVVALASNMRFEPSTIRSRRGPQEIDLVVRNPFPFMIEGELEFGEPEDWSIAPLRRSFRVEANGEQRIPLTVRWDRIPQLGQVVVPVQLRADVDRSIDTRISVPLEVVSPNIKVEVDWSIATSTIDGRDGLVVTLEVMNRGNRPVDLEAIAVAWQVGRERIRISDLEPGDHAIRRFQFKAGLDRLAGTEMLVTVEDLDGPDAVVVAVPIAGMKRQAVVVPSR
ncbi:MAG: hypothetical protein MK085_01260 [Phycisphaerales bacterium]|nr:hypothetical protein [Phycisphaerales bacterium]